MSDNDQWQVLSGCHTCINTHVCKELGNCVLLNIEQCMPEYNKAKQRLIQKIRTYGNGSIEQIEIYLKKIEPVTIPEKPTFVRLTQIEKLFIKSLKRKR